MSDGKELISRVDTAEAESKSLKVMCADAAEVIRGLGEMLDTQAKIIASNGDLIRLMNAREGIFKARVNKVGDVSENLAEALRDAIEEFRRVDFDMDCILGQKMTKAIAKYEASK